MVILLLVGIFAFVAAAIFRSNKALQRVEAVERGLGVLEDKMKEAKAKEVVGSGESPHVSVNPSL